ncbi:diphosphomevalonate decarboxylase-like [Acanthaster planci]|uniref:Diphosphomevalonate decarboxylase n=1 Tax=Acanthaster planci TaxID=133434 RepID=A0A8B7YKG8_ACAPL|nr:diphosphomevalonate decarboxylase-like [Acanthaster planci]
MKIVTCRAPVNIAVIKYWGKRNEQLILPVNSSLSATLHIDQLCTKTTVAASNAFQSDRIWLNGKEQSLDNPRLQKCLREIRQRARKRKSSPSKDDSSSAGEGGCDPEQMLDWHVHICSENNFPTAAGLASSAAGYACLVASLAQVYGVEGNVSDIARQGSGSACRSMYGGFVEWLMGRKRNGEDSIAKQVVSEDYWPEIRILILVVSDQKKATSSTTGMQATVQTSPLLKYRADVVVPERMAAIATAIKERNFESFAELTMKDSNQFHAVCLDTHPPISYMNDTSRTIVRLVHGFNAFHNQTKAAYTFDAGPNAVIFTLEDDVEELLSLVNYFFPQGEETNGASFIRGIPADLKTPSEELQAAVPFDPRPNSLRYIIHTKVGPGPATEEDSSQHLLDRDGQPKNLPK